MTAELFIKLCIKLYKERKHLLPASDRDADSETNETPIPQATHEESITSDEEESSQSSNPSSGGVSLNPIIKASSPLKEPKPLDYALPIEYIAKQMNITSTAFAKGDRQWMPRIDSGFWDEYVNKLRVNASDKGVCDLEEVDDENPGVESPK